MLDKSMKKAGIIGKRSLIKNYILRNSVFDTDDLNISNEREKEIELC